MKPALMSASLIGHGSQAPFTASLASWPRGSRFFPWSASDQVRLPQALVGRDGKPRFGARLRAQQTFAASPMPSSTRATILQRAVAETSVVTLCGLLRLHAELSAVDPHRVKDHGELACDRHQGAFAPFRSRQPTAPCLERRRLGRSGHDDIGSRIKRRANFGISGLGNVTRVVSFA
jgi:hypothetical protein